MEKPERDKFLKDMQALGLVQTAMDQINALKPTIGLREAWTRTKAMFDAGTLIAKPVPSAPPPDPVIIQRPVVIERVIEVPAPRARERESEPVKESPTNKESLSAGEAPRKKRSAGMGAAAPRRVVEWIFENLDPSQPIDEEHAPSRGAIGYLKRLRANEELQDEFYKGNWAKLLPTKAELDREAQMRDDGRSHKDLIARVRSAHDRFRSRQPVSVRT